MKIIFKIFLWIALIIVSLILIYRFIGQPQQIWGNSMSPFLSSGSFVLSSKITYIFRAPQRGDVVTFLAPGGTLFISRIIGLPGDKIQLINGKVSVNGTELYEPYLPPGTKTFPSDSGYSPSTDLKSAIIVPENHFFMLSDNREHANDRRSMGYIQRKSIYGVVLTKVGR